MSQAGDLNPLPVPDEQAWRSIGLECGAEMHGGLQSRVFEADLNGVPVVAKLTDSRMVDDSFERRIEMVAALAEMDDVVVGPIPLKAGAVTRLGEWFVVVYPLIIGRAPDVTSEGDVRLMGSTLAALHESLGRLEDVDLPPVAALSMSDRLEARGFSPTQLLHSDFSHKNVLLAGEQAHVFDFDDCGYGPVEFEVGNTLYMVLFDASISSEMQRYEQFREWFVDQYRSASGKAVSDELVDESIALRVQALKRWVEHPETAPIGIRTATPAWHEQLRAFIQSHTTS